MSILCSMVGASFTVTAAALVGRTQKTITAVNNAQISTAQSQFGGASALFDGTGDYLVSSVVEDSFGTSNFTVEFWYRPAAIGAIQVPIGNRSSGTGLNIWWVEIGADGTAYAAFQNSVGTSYYPASPSTYTANTWHHIAIVRNGTTLTFYRNGVGGTAVTGVSGSFGGGVYYIGGIAASYNVNGYLDEIRVSNTARYTANFTSSTIPFINDANTLLLVHADGTNASTVFTDDASLIITPAADNVNEGSSLTFNVTTVGATDQTLYYTVTNAGDFGTSSGSFSLTSNAGSFSVTPTADTTTEGAETFTASIRTESTSGPIIATSSAVTINDTSVSAPTYPLTTAFNSTIGTNIEYTYQDYSDSSTAYVGPDSSNNPVFMFVYRRASNSFLYGILARINTDATVTTSTDSTFGL